MENRNEAQTNRNQTIRLSDMQANRFSHIVDTAELPLECSLEIHGLQRGDIQTDSSEIRCDAHFGAAESNRSVDVLEHSKCG